MSRIPRLGLLIGSFVLVLSTLALSSPHAAAQRVTAFTLINADTDAPIGLLEDGDELNLATLPTRNLNVRADTDGATASVRFAYDGDSNYRTESTAPFALAGDAKGDYVAWTPTVGSHTLTATPYTETKASGTAGPALTVNFTVIDEGDGEPPPPPPSPGCTSSIATPTVEGELRRWHAVTVSFEGPCTSEDAATNPFTDYRLNVTITHTSTGTAWTVPGYYAADGNAAQTGADKGRIWRAHFLPSKTGAYTFEASFRTGSDVAVSASSTAGTATSFDGTTGSFSITETNKTGRDHRAKGLLRYVDKRYLRYETGEYFLKGGADSPENFLAYEDFDGTYNHGGTDYIKSYTAHKGDWKSGDPTWAGGRGKGMIGALNYLSGKGMNAVYFLTMNVNGDGKDVWPWTSHTVYDRFDVSKLDQWNVVFDHMDRKGMLLHVVTQETENDQLLDGGNLGPDRKLYFRELIARFAHHHAISWNLGEENSNTEAQRKAFSDYIKSLDAYDHPVVLHTRPGEHDEVYEPLLGYPSLDGPSLQLGTLKAHSSTLKWVAESEANGKPWVVNVDEIGPGHTGVKPDGPDNNHDEMRHKALWANLMAGGGGVEWYFGYRYDHSDVTAEDWRSRDNMWTYTDHALAFFREHLPFWKMTADDELTAATEDYVFKQDGQTYAIYIPSGGTAEIATLPAGSYSVRWFNPRTGGSLKQGTVSNVKGGSDVEIGSAPNTTSEDWVALLTTGPLPVELTRFDAVVDGEAVTLHWTTQTETNNAGFDVEQQYLAADTPDAAFERVGFVSGYGTTLEQQTYTHTLDDLAPGRYAFRLKQIDFDGAFEYSPVVEIAIEAPEQPRLSAPAPNPFTNATTFSLTVPRAQHVTVDVVDVLGRRVAQLHDTVLEADTPHRFRFDADGLASGLYFIRAQGTQFLQTLPVVLNR